MDDPETRDREPDGTEEPEPGGFMMRAGPEGNPETIGTSHAGAVGPGQAALDGVLGAEGPTTAIDTEEATAAPRALSCGPAIRNDSRLPSVTKAGWVRPDQR